MLLPGSARADELGTALARDVSGVPFRDALGTVRLGGCLTAYDAWLPAALDELRAAFLRLAERRNVGVAWAVFERALDDLPSEPFLLTTTWIDDPATARRLYACEDDLPRSWRRADKQDLARDAVLWFDAAVAERERALRSGGPADREQAVMDLAELRKALLRRYAAQFGASGDDTLLQLLDSRLARMWETLVDPFFTGYTPRARATEPITDPKALGRAKFRFPTAGLPIPDPRDVAARDRVARSWRRQRESMDRELRGYAEQLEDTEAAIGAERDPETLDRLARDAARLDAQLASTTALLERLSFQVRNYSTGRPWVDDMLSAGYRRRAVRRFDRREDTVALYRDRTEEAVADAVARGAMPPGQARDGGLFTGRITGDTSQPGPGNWLEGFPERADAGAPGDTGTSGDAGDVSPIAPGTGWVERTYEGPMPTPSGAFSQPLCDAIRARHGELDEDDVRILLGLVQLAYRELGSRQAVEDAVFRSLQSSSGLRLLGEERTLSDLWIRGRAQAEQPIVTFVLRLLF